MDDNFQDMNLNTPEVEDRPVRQQTLADKLKALPMPMKVVLAVGGFLLLYSVFSGSDTPAPQPRPQTTQGGQSSSSLQALNNDTGTQQDTDAFEAFDKERPTLQRRFVEQQQMALESLREEVQAELESKKGELAQIENTISTQTRQMQQMIESFNTQMRNMEDANRRTLQEISRLATENRQRNEHAPVADNYVSGENAPPRRSGRITQTGPLGVSAQGVNVDPSRALLSPIVRQAESLDAQEALARADDIPPPFMPPLGFVRGTLLNGFDALAGGGRATPALVRLSGKYNTAMNSTVLLDGCLMLVEFEGDVSTERAIGKPSRMTCVYPDRGAVTYDVTGYVVDERDGIVGVPGVFYEGDPTRIASAMVADFAAGIAGIVEQNQNTFTVDSDGTTQKTLTGNQTKAELAGGVANVMSSLRDYLFERANRVVPFVRVDNTRDIHLVILNGTELREEGSPWTLLFDGLEKDARQQAREAQQRADAQTQANNAAAK